MQPLSRSPSTSASASPIIAMGEGARRASTKLKDSFQAYQAAEKALAADPKYNKFKISVEKCLQSFDNVNEWADFITFLAKLLKCLQTYPQFQVIPHKLTVAKRLSQCLNPALPTGVHQRALDVYTHILTAIGPENLRRDLPAWSSGLFPFFQYAATSVKPIVLGIYERFYLPLQESLRPATKAFILALLPGLEEETGEFFEQVAALLDRVSGTVSPAFFFQNVWLVLVTAPNSRISALNYLSKRLPKMQDDDSVTSIVGLDVGLMVRGFAAALEDPQILVQRGILDLLTTTLKLNSVGFKSTRREDQVLLMRAVSGVVLRRDLSLSRRLYTWLLGASDSSEVQIKHLKDHGLELLHLALKMDMNAQSTETVDRQRPFKIFISLLDKWEIGAPLTEILVLDAFAALQVSLRPNDDHDELLMTGNMLFEIIDPFLMWKRLYASLRNTIIEGESETAIELARFIVRTFRLHDEEVQKLHAPFVAFGILDLVETSHQDTTRASNQQMLTSAIEFAGELLEEISPKLFESDFNDYDDPPAQYCSTMANSLYEASDMKTALIPETDGRELLSAGLATVLRLAESCATKHSTMDQLLLPASLKLLDSLSIAASHSDQPLAIDWTPSKWTGTFISLLGRDLASTQRFQVHGAVIRSILVLSKMSSLRPAMELNDRSLVKSLTEKLLDYLQPHCAPCFVESVALMWGVQELTTHRHVESMISERLTSADPTIRLPTFEAFGNLWRFTEDAQLPGVVLRNAMLLVLDSLKADDLSTRRAGEAWMRCSLKSYLRILDPLMFTLLDRAIEHHSIDVTVAGLELPILVYQTTFDQARVHHILDDLLSLTRFGGQGFVRIAKGSFLKHTLDPAFRDRVRASDLDTRTYLDGLTTVLVRFLRTEPAPELTESMDSLNQHIHSIVAELLQVIISRGESDLAGLQSIESALSSRLYLCIHRAELDLQNKLLHVLHSVVHAIAALRRNEKVSIDLGKNELKARDLDNLAQPAGITHDAMFVKIVSDAISKQQNSAVVHHWIDFLLMTIPQIRHSLVGIVLPLIDCLIGRLRSIVQELNVTYTFKKSGISSEATDAEYTVIMNALERLLLIAVSEARAVSVDIEPKSPMLNEVVSTPSGGGGLLGYMTGVLASAEIESIEISEEEKIRRLALNRLRDAVNLLLLSWDVASLLESSTSLEHSSQTYFSSRTKLRARKAFERVYKAVPADVLEGIVVYWEKSRNTGATESNIKLFAILDILAPSAQSVVTLLCEKISRPSRILANPLTPSDDSILSFLEAYIERMEGSSAVLVWSVCLSFVRELLSNISTTKIHIFSGLRIFTALSEKVSQTSALEDRRMRRDLQETFLRLTDASILIAGRAVEVGGWVRKPIVETNGDTESIHSIKADIDPTEEKRPQVLRSQAHDITDFLAQRVLPDLRRFLIDADKTVSVCSNMVYYIVSPTFKTRSKTVEIEPSVFELLIEMVKNPTTLKAWKTPIQDAFADNRFFNALPSAHEKWKPLIQALMASDKERLVEITAKISTVSSANIFTNRELESLSRALSLRRLTYTIFTAEKNRFLTQLPIIQEKLVDLLRSSVGDMVHAEVYLCLRVLLCRIGNQHLAGLWPVILTELLRLFESLVDHAVPDGSDLLQLILSACKFLDLTLVLQTDDFQIHQWMFVTDTVDAIYPPDVWFPQAIMDRLGEILADPHRFNSQSNGDKLIPNLSNISYTTSIVPRSPLLTIKKIETISGLATFFASVSLAAYESVYYSGGLVDWKKVENGLEEDLFDGI